jgi:hypothetical protein
MAVGTILWISPPTSPAMEESASQKADSVTFFIYPPRKLKIRERSQLDSSLSANSIRYDSMGIRYNSASKTYSCVCERPYQSEQTVGESRSFGVLSSLLDFHKRSSFLSTKSDEKSRERAPNAAADFRATLRPPERHHYQI